MASVLETVSGYKTYIAAAALALTAVVAFIDGEFQRGTELLAAALAVAGLRHGIAKQAGE